MAGVEQFGLALVAGASAINGGTARVRSGLVHVRLCHQCGASWRHSPLFPSP